LQLWIKQLDRGPATRVADAGGAASWAPDGKSLLFVVPGRASFQRVPADGSVLPERVPGVGGSPQYSPDGRWIVQAWRGDLYAQRTDGDTTPVPLVRDPSTQSAPTLSPDGRWLAYVSDESGVPQVYVRPFPDTRVAKRQLSTGQAWAPRWSRSGRELFYFELDAAGATRLVAVDVLPGATFSTGRPNPLFSVMPFGPNATHLFDVSPDGKRFLFTRIAGQGGAEAQRDRLVLVQNFGAELKAKVGK
jgi:Tol biopolymer transport system component